MQKTAVRILWRKWKCTTIKFIKYKKKKKILFEGAHDTMKIYVL